MKLTLVEFKTHDNLNLPALFYTPDNSTEKVAVFLHGSSSSVFYSVERMNKLAETLNDNDIAFFSFNNRGANVIKRLTRNRGDEEKEEKIMQGTAYELIEDCVIDIESALDHLEIQGYKEFYLIGHSTGANKIALYNYLQPENRAAKYVLLGAGDDTGLAYQAMGKSLFEKALKKSREVIDKGKGENLIPKYYKGLFGEIMSYQSLYDVINPDGGFNTFPFFEYINNLKLSKKELFREYKSINKPTLNIYGSLEEYCSTSPENAVEIFKKVTNNAPNFEYKIIKGADHGFEGKNKELGEVIIHFLK